MQADGAMPPKIGAPSSNTCFEISLTVKPKVTG
jgi:hypothetical protein